MKISYDRYMQPDRPKIYLATPGKKILCALNGVEEASFSLTRNLNNTNELSFDVYQYVTVDGEQVQSNGYDWLTVLMKIKVDGVGWFILNPPSTSNDGTKEIKHIVAESSEIEFQQHDLKGLKINCGTSDSYEIASVPDNVGLHGETEYALEQIKFYNKNKTDLSLLHILLKESGVGDWEIGHVDDIPKTYDEYQDDGSIVQKTVLLQDEVGTFEIDSQDLYSFMTQEMSQYFGCIFDFDTENYRINVWRVENIGKDTNININFRNIENSNDVEVDEENLFTRFFIRGGEDLNIRYVNFGLDYIENLDYFLNEKYLSRETIDKYKLWRSDVEEARELYVDASRRYNEQMLVRDEIKNRLPLDGCSTDWSTFVDADLQEALDNYRAQIRGYEKFYNDDMEALEASVDAADYHQIKDVIVPSILIEMNNRMVDEDDRQEYIDTYKTNWDLYGLDELQNSLTVYQNTVSAYTENGYNVPWTSDSGHTKEFHDSMYAKYLDASNQLNANWVDPDTGKHSCQWAFNQRQQEYNDATTALDNIGTERSSYGNVGDKSKWEHDNGDGTTTSFTTSEIFSIARLYIDGDYQNDNIITTSLDDQVTTINSELQLLRDAQNELSIASQPQFAYSTSLDNFLANYGYSDYTKQLNEGDFLYLGVRDDYVVKLRVTSISYNPLVMDNELSISFSNMIRSKSSRNDFTYLLGLSNASGKNVVSGSSSSSSGGGGVEITTSLLNHIVQSPAFTNQVNNVVGNSYGGYISTGGKMTVDELNAKMIEVTDIRGQNAFFDYIQSEFIKTNKIVADSASFQNVSTLAANINTLLAGTAVAELGHIIKLTSSNVSIDEAVISNLIASQITVAMLKAGDISTDKFNVKSNDGGLVIEGNTMQFYDANNNIRIQIGRDANDDFTFTLYDEDGQGVLIDENGIHSSAISDGLIVNDMIGDGEISKDKLAFNTVEADADGNVSASKVMINGQGMDVAYTTITTSISDLQDEIDSIQTGGVIQIVLGNESRNVPCNGSGVVKETFRVRVPFSVYKGSDKIASTVSVTIPSTLNGVSLYDKADSTAGNDGYVEFQFDRGSTVSSTVPTGQIPIVFNADGKSYTRYFSWTKTNDGIDGSATFYDLNADTPVLMLNSDSELNPSTIVFNATYRNSGSTATSPYPGRFIIQEQASNGSWSNKYSSASDESSKSYTVTSDDILGVRCYLCASGSVVDQLDMVTIPTIGDDTIASKLGEITTQISGVRTDVNAANTAITNEVWRDTMIEVGGQTVNMISQITTNTTNVDGVTQRVSAVETGQAGIRERVSSVEQTANGLTTRVSDAEGNISTLTQTANSLGTRISDAEGNITTLTQTSTALDTKITNEIEGRETLIRDYENGTLTCKVGNGYGVLTDAEGAVKIVTVTWVGENNDEPLVGDTVSSFGTTAQIGQDGKWRVLITDTDVQIIDENGDVVSVFSDDITIGKDGDTRVTVDFNSLKLIDKNDNEYFYVGDLRDEHGVATLVERYTLSEGDVIDSRVVLNAHIADGDASNILYAKLNGTALTYNDDYAITTLQSNALVFNPALTLNEGDVFEISYKSSDDTLKVYTLGDRADGETSGAMSFAHGYEVVAGGQYANASGYKVVASGNASHAEGYGTSVSPVTASGDGAHAEGHSTIASGSESHSEGYLCRASGVASHAEGFETISSGDSSHSEGESSRADGQGAHAEGIHTYAIGNASHAQNRETTAEYDNTTAIGRYNISGDYPLMVGNGTRTSDSNAFTVAWDGEVSLDLNTTAQSGVDHDLYTAITALGWANDVIV